MLLRVAALLILALVAGAPVAGAQALEGPMVDGLRTRGTVKSDGVRYAVVPVAGGARVVDDAKGRAYDVPAPEDSCFARGVGGGHLLWGCGAVTTAQKPLLTDLTTGLTFEPPGWRAALAGSDSAYFDAVGASWLGGYASGYHYFIPVYLDWHTGRVGRTAAPAAQVARRVIDLDAGSLVRGLCSPLRRLPDPDQLDSIEVYGDGFLPYGDYRPPVGLAVGPLARGGPLRLERCHGRPRTLSRCRPQRCRYATLSAGYASWLQGRRLYTYELRRRRRASQLLPEPSASPGSVVHTATAIYVSSYLRDPVAPGSLVHRVARSRFR